ncbi:gp53-like domain-containing protein [Salmonella enterica]
MTTPDGLSVLLAFNNGIWGLRKGASYIPLPLVSGGTGANDAATARVSLGLGTAAQRDIGTSATYQVPSMDSFSYNKSASGFQVLPSGVIIQWGMGGYSDNQVVALPTTFPNLFGAVCISSNPSETAYPEISQAYPISLNQFRTGCSTWNGTTFNPTALTCKWMAIGY